MKLEGVKIRNFRGIRNLDIDFTDALNRIRDLTLIVGPNGSGKTSILDAIWFGLLGEIRYPLQRESFRVEPEYVVTTGHNYTQVEYEIDITDEERDLINKWKNELVDKGVIKPYRDNTLNKAQIVWTYPAQPGFRALYGYGGYRYSQNYDWAVLKGKSYSRTLKDLTASPVDDAEMAGGIHFFEQERRIIARPFQQYKPIAEDESFASIQSNGVIEVKPQDDTRALLIDLGVKDKIGRYRGDRSWYQKIRESYNYICAPRKMGEVYTLKDSNEFEIEFSDKDGVKYGFDGLSSGERSVLNFMAQYVYKRMFNSVVLIDELELHLHPTRQRRLLENLIRLDDGNQFIITTHSPTLLQAIHSEAIIELGQLDEIPKWQSAEISEHDPT